MNKKLLELLNQINEKKTMVQNLVEQGRLEEAKEVKNELTEMQTQFDLLKDVLDPEGNGTAEPQNATPVPNKEPEDSTKEFANAARRGFRNATMTEGTPADGGYTVPEDIQTRINALQQIKDREPSKNVLSRPVLQKWAKVGKS